MRKGNFVVTNVIGSFVSSFAVLFAALYFDWFTELVKFIESVPEGEATSWILLVSGLIVACSSILNYMVSVLILSVLDYFN